MSLIKYSVPSDDFNNFTGPTRELSGPARTGLVQTNVPFGEVARWLYVGVTGNVSYIKPDGSTQLLLNMQAGIWHRMYLIQVNSSLTTATNMVWGS